MEINGVLIVDDTLVITLDTKLPDTVSEDLYLYIDTLDNYAKRNSTEPSDHSYDIKVMNAEEGDLVEISEDRYYITLELNKFEPRIVESAFTVTFDGYCVFYYDTEELYYKQIDLLCNNCSTCLDDQQKDRIMLFILKYNLLQYAIEHNIMDDAVQYYRDLARMLNICITNNVYNDGHYDCNRCCCKNGSCSLC